VCVCEALVRLCDLSTRVSNTQSSSLNTLHSPVHCRSQEAAVALESGLDDRIPYSKLECGVAMYRTFVEVRLGDLWDAIYQP
jgi:hypothetical protein